MTKLWELIKTDYSAAQAARNLLEMRNNRFDAKPFAFSNTDDLCAIEENVGSNSVWVLMDKTGMSRAEVLDAVDNLWGEVSLDETLDEICKFS
jgi:hypothetical protein